MMRGVPAVRFLPNAITVLAVASGLTSVVFALQTDLPNHWTFAIAAIALSAILDALDGPAARLLHSMSKIGAQLDSLSDAVSFGVAPTLVIYIWLLHVSPLGWAACLVYAVCTVLRLARFNSLLEDDSPRPWAKGFFMGIPSPAGALLALAPLALWVRLGHGFWSSPWVVGVWLVLLGLLMISRVPSIALKAVRVPPQYVLPLLVLLVIGAAALAFEPLLTLVGGLVVYLLHLPYAGWKFSYLRAHPELLGGPAVPVRRLSTRRVRLHVPRRRRVAGLGADGRPLPRERRGVARVRGLRRHNGRPQ